MRIPIIDLKNHSQQQQCALIDAACRDTGFFVLKGHEVSAALVEQTFAQSQRFFRLSATEKMASWKAHEIDDRGYFPAGLQALDYGTPPDLSEFIMLGLEVDKEHPFVQAKIPMYGPNPWPIGLEKWRETMQQYQAATIDLSKQLLRLVAMNLDLPLDYFDERATLPIASLKLAWYPPRPTNAQVNQHGVGAHTDWGALTLVAGDGTPGLQVRTSEGEWLDVPTIPDSFIVNVGDMLQRWTNDIYRSGVHRVLSTPNQERFSLVLFFDMDYHASLQCIPSCASAQTPPKYELMLAGEYLMSRYKESLDIASTSIKDL